MKTRVISGLIMLPLLLVVYFGGIALTIACMLVGIIGVKEFYGGFRSINIKPSYAIALFSIASLYALNMLQVKEEAYMHLWFFGVVLLSLIYLFRVDFRALEDGMATITGIFYVVFFSYHVVLVEQSEYSILIWLIFLSAFGTDIMAYFSGYLFGKHKLCPKISPKKTIEGSIGGTLGSIILCVGFGALFAEGIIIHCAVIGLLGGIISQLGDLTASIFKRKMGIKDYGNLIPGHGGVLDRFDSVLFTAPMVYYYIMLVL
ncbi:MAG: phosphatidate cytidylyltransferase [Eubacteriales bacterium]|nr:phosphatidate cytidylyltransferase [Eubacteriales bacterium]MDD4389796.1 phosphatidate cytidylyltransferase [Eubacteriales bacterium]